MDKWINDKLHSSFSYFKGLTALDLGCGEGTNTVGLAKLGIEVTAVDKQSIMIEKTQELADKERAKITTMVSEIQDFRPNTQYNIVLFTHVLHFIPNKNKEHVVQKAIDSVKSGGILVFADLEDDFLVPVEYLSILETSLKNIEIERFSIKDGPHLGADYPHQHKVFYLIGTKQ